MKRISINAGWKFYKKGQEEKATIVNLPHDAMQFEARISRLKNGSFTGYYPGGDYIYTRKLFSKDEYASKTIMLEFEGVYMDSTVYLNDEPVGGRFYGYSNFTVDLTGKLRIRQDNEIKVFVHNSRVPNTRWYSGSGIYRPVKLIVGNPEHIELDGVKIVTKSIKPAVIEVTVQTSTLQTAEIQTAIYCEGKVVASGIGAKCELTIPDAKLWDVNHPKLYHAHVQLLRNGEILDEVEERFGIRTLEWNAQEGLKVNGKSVKLRGACVHHDNGILGAAAFEAAEHRKARILKEAGFNAIRSAHQPITKSLLNACDELGLYVMDEAFDTWQMNVGLYDYALAFDEDWEKDIRAMVLNDMNHPSVIMYSIGNEIKDTAHATGAELAGKMSDLIHRMDSTRPVTVCPNLIMNTLELRGRAPKLTDQKEFHRKDITNPLAEEKDSKVGGSVWVNLFVAAAPYLMKFIVTPKTADKATSAAYANVDIAGYNYGHRVYLKHLEMYPERILVGSETLPPAIAKNWALVEKDPRIIGDFMWAGIEYLGEGGAGVTDYQQQTGKFFKPYPVIASGCGVIDLTGYRDTFAHLAAIVWGMEANPYIAVRPVNRSGEKAYFSIYRNSDAVNSWSWKGCEGRKAKIEVYSPGYAVELIQDGKSLGKKRLKDFVAKFDTNYRPGTLETISFDKTGKAIGQSLLKTASDETILTVMPEATVLKANGEDLAFIQVHITDNAGIVKSLQDKVIHVRVEGAGTLQAVGSGVHRTTESYTGTSFTTHYGRMLAVVRSGFEQGEIKVTFSAEGLVEKVILLKVER